MFMLVPKFSSTNTMFKLHTFKKSISEDARDDFYSKNYVLFLDNQTNSLKKYFQHLVFEGFDARWTDSHEEAFDSILHENIRVVISHVNLIDSDITQFSKRLAEISYSGTIVPVLNDPLAKRAIKELGFEYRHFISNLRDRKRNDLLISILKEKENDHPIESLPYINFSEKFEISIPSMPQLIERVNQYFLQKSANVDSINQHTNAIRMSISEAVANAIEHGNKFDINKNVFISFLLTRQKLIIGVRDEGEGFKRPPAKSIKSANKGHSTRGRGIHIMKKSMDLVRYNKMGNSVVMKKNLISED